MNRASHQYTLCAVTFMLLVMGETLLPDFQYKTRLMTIQLVLCLISSLCAWITKD